MIENKFKQFLDNSLLLNNEFNISPLLYGSLGLEVLTNTNLNSDDIDILIPDIFINGDMWDNLKSYLESNGYKMIDENEHAFLKDDVCYSYASIESLEKFAGIKVSEIIDYNKDRVNYKLLTLEQYLKVYKASLLDDYRVNVFKKKNKDLDKIDFINFEIKKRIK